MSINILHGSPYLNYKTRNPAVVQRKFRVTLAQTSQTQSFPTVQKLKNNKSLPKLTLDPINKIEGVVTLPGSKSLSNRVLLLAALADGQTVVENLLDSDDIRYMVGALRVLGVDLTEDWANRTMSVRGCRGKFPANGGDLFFGRFVPG
eukprot:TRINITY_DN24284_c0_g1_i1.p2 TRINITY_DN24284_c0_g1~~TRINITY_DN24284_c0_g1_i1.p2  ORF type:complete len:148 (-),score=18.89 TRINITY_DN24284_c0_g1_i1:10-453(-)